MNMAGEATSEQPGPGAGAVDHGLVPCPFCGGGETEIRENGRMWTGVRFSAPTSVSVWHHCPRIEGQPHRGIERVGRDLESAIAAWNRRA